MLLFAGWFHLFFSLQSICCNSSFAWLQMLAFAIHPMLLYLLFIYLFSCASTSVLFLNRKGYNPWDQRKFSIWRLDKITRLEKQGVWWKKYITSIAVRLKKVQIRKVHVLLPKWFFCKLRTVQSKVPDTGPVSCVPTTQFWHPNDPLTTPRTRLSSIQAHGSLTPPSSETTVKPSRAEEEEAIGSIIAIMGTTWPTSGIGPTMVNGWLLLSIFGGSSIFFCPY